MKLEEFQQADLRVGKVVIAERVPGSEKLVRLEVDLGEKNEAGDSLSRQIIAGVGKTYAPENLIGREIIVVTNLDPRTMMGLESKGMLLAATDESGEPVLLGVDKETSPGARVK